MKKHTKEMIKAGVLLIGATLFFHPDITAGNTTSGTILAGAVLGMLCILSRAQAGNREAVRNFALWFFFLLSATATWIVRAWNAPEGLGAFVAAAATIVLLMQIGGKTEAQDPASKRSRRVPKDRFPPNGIIRN
jgi:FtsH-binding integral membrane protein